tara:strand:+ start:36192 stop:37763 length:1572 start_codon:yes stop_codon:yes gene_type:complete
MKLKEKKAKFLTKLFQHLDGIVLIPTVIELSNKKIIPNFSNCKLKNIAKKYNANSAYLHVALRILCSQGIIKQEINKDDTIEFQVNETTNYKLTQLINNYSIIKPLYLNEINYSVILKNTDISSSNNSSQILEKVITDYIKKFSTNHKESFSRNHIEGAIIGPILVHLLMGKKLKEDFTDWCNLVSEKWIKKIKMFFVIAGILNKKHELTDYGLFLFKRASSYGVTVSYLPTYRNIGNLLFGNYKSLWSKIGEEEKHVDRAMNVWGSGGAHKTYFKKIDQIILDLFNQPIEKQPKGFIDIGCGNGKFIEHIFDLIYYKTKRGKQLNQYPLFIVGSDFNYKALEATQKTIHNADIWAKTAFGDISDPENLALKLKKEHQINLEDLLNVRSFLDHNRIYNAPKKDVINKSKSTGAFCQKGKKISNHLLQQNLQEHFEKWYPYLKKYGLLIVELHTINPTIAAQNIGKTAITAYDASHGFSDQYIIEYEYFLQSAKEVGLIPDKNHEFLFPSKEIPIVSINRLIKN